jgi:hypothetical protein
VHDGKRGVISQIGFKGSKVVRHGVAGSRFHGTVAADNLVPEWRDGRPLVSAPAWLRCHHWSPERSIERVD